MKRFLFPLSLLALAVPLGFVLGLGTYTFYYAEGASYFSENPKTCANCHIMNHQYDTWIKSGHHHVATCNDCHLPKGGIQKYIAKARNGWNHSLAFTLENFHQPIQITRPNQEILQENCVRCHGNLVKDAILTPAGGSHQAQSCTHCHRNIGHFPIQ
ncbi:MAG: cytochrome c nitrite reductase small subunit [Oligoflexia bacterium]|nr:cytochrome c nitrite reductase small subunit [Oligoflexia bacterium]